MKFNLHFRGRYYRSLIHSAICTGDNGQIKLNGAAPKLGKENSVYPTGQ